MIIGVAGTAKNTGKTTALCTLIATAHARGRLPGVTGIGYDGEERDTVTLLPKPRITVFPGMIVTTSERCLPSSTARLRILKRTGIFTPLGEVMITVAEEKGLAVVAGPNKTSDLSSVARAMGALGVSDLLVDGSLNRIAPMVVADRVVVATGAARSTDIALLSEETSAIEKIFNYPLCPVDYAAISGIRLAGRDVQVQCVTNAFHTAADIARATEKIPEGLATIVIPGMVAAEGLALLVDRLRLVRREGFSIVLDNPFGLLLAGEPLRVGGILRELEGIGAGICYRRRTELAAVTFNPYYPAFDGTTYRAAYLDAAGGKAALASALTTPVIDVVEEGGAALFRRCYGTEAFG